MVRLALTTAKHTTRIGPMLSLMRLEALQQLWFASAIPRDVECVAPQLQVGERIWGSTSTLLARFG